MIEIILIIALAVIFVILLRRLPEVNVDDSTNLATYTVPATTALSPVIMTPKPVSGEKVMDLWQEAEKEFGQKNFSKAEKLYLKIATLDPKNPQVYGKLGAIYMEQKNYLDAKNAFGEAAKDDAKNPLWFNNLGLALYNLKRFSEAIEVFKKSTALDDSKASRFFNLGLAYEAMGEIKSALQVYERAASLEPENAEFQTLIIRIREEMKNKNN